MDIDEKTRQLFGKVLKCVGFFGILYSLFFLSGELLAYHTGGYSYERSSSGEEFIIDNKVTGEMIVYPYNVETEGIILELLVQKYELDLALIFSSLYATLLLLGLIGIIVPEYRIIKSLKIYLPLLGVIILSVTLLQYNNYSPEIKEINHLIEALNQKV
ncbi:hypothetical protein [Oceanobacillus bengalensis]|uniref:Uncharacterized protein n=1 Tax=Oceanobacillus bengalensis TaxID=1435466 RepID=A0A494Z7U4_9BACI|nr:hypothetical protein [Oceanobacillus bengalensis]RKQ18682.1 hypothetical protein D8M05_00795 [Oceanobacillus bengalensis]